MCWTVLSWLTGNISRLQPRKSPTYSIKPSKATTFSSFKALSSSLFANLMISWSPATSLLRSRLTSCRANSPQNYPVFAKLFSTESRINYRLPNMTRGSHLVEELVVVLVFVCDKQWHNRLTHLHIFFKKKGGRGMTRGIFLLSGFRFLLEAIFRRLPCGANRLHPRPLRSSPGLSSILWTHFSP